MTDSKGFVPYYYNHNKILYNKFEFLEKLMYFSFLKLCWNHAKIVRDPTNMF